MEHVPPGSMSPGSALAAATAGEAAFDVPPFKPAASGDAAIPGPIAAVKASIAGFMRGFAQVVKNPKTLLPAGILGVVWLALGILASLGIEPLPVRVVEALTFARGGLSRVPAHVAGGLVGKGLLAAMVAHCFAGRGFLRQIRGGFATVARLLGGGGGAAGFAPMALGAGAALVVYNFMAGNAAPAAFMAAVPSLLLALRSVGGGGGLIKRLAASLTARHGGRDTANRFVSGGAVGFALALPLSAVPLGYIGYLAGGLGILAGAALAVHAATSKKEAAQ